MTNPFSAKDPTYDALIKYFRTQEIPSELTYTPMTGPPTSDVASFILTNSSLKPRKALKKKKEEDPSLMSRIFDALSRTNYAAANFVDEVTGGGDVGDAFNEAWEGFTGRDKTTFSDVLENRGMEEGLPRTLLGLGLDIFADPLTYVPVAGIVAKAKNLRKAKIPDKVRPLEEKLLARGEPIEPDLFGLPRKVQNIPVALDKKQADLSKVFAPKDVTRPTGGQLALPLAGVPMPRTQSPTMPGQSQPVAGVDVEQVLRGASKTQNVSGPLKGQGQFTFKSYKKDSVWKDPRLNKVREALNRGSFGSNKIVDRVVNGDVNAVRELEPKPLANLDEFADRRLKQAADQIVEFRSPRRFAAKHTLNRADQVHLWNKARTAAVEIVKKRKRKKADFEQNVLQRTVKIYGEIERQFAELGYHFEFRLGNVLGDLMSRNIPITDNMIKEFGRHVKPGSEIWRALQVEDARKAIAEAPKVKEIADEVSEASNIMRTSEKVSHADVKNFDEYLRKFGQSAAKVSDLSESGLKATDGLIKQAVFASKGSTQVAIERKTKDIEEILRTGRNNPSVAEAMTKGISEELGPLPRNKAENVTEWIMARMATQHGQKDLRPLTLDWMASARRIAQIRGNWLQKTFAPFNDAQRINAFRAAQGYEAPMNSEVLHLSSEISRLMENMAGKVTGQSVLTRAAIPPDMINKWLKRFGSELQFGKTAIDPFTKRKVQLDSWLDSWKYTDIEFDPQIFLFKTQEAMEMATRERAVFDDLGQRFGSKFRNRDYRFSVSGHPYLEGYYFPKEIADQIPRFVKDWSIPEWAPHNKAIKFYDRALSMWKAGVTIYRPGHHIRNMFGDTYLAWMDGVNSIRPFTMAMKVLRTQGDTYPDLLKLDEMVELGLAPNTMRTPAPKDILFRNKSGVSFTTEQIWAVANNKGLMEVAKTIEDIVDFGDEAAVLGKPSLMRPLGGRGQQVARRISELQQHTARLAHFIDKVKKSRGGNLDEIFDQAARRARKWHPTGLDLTEFERKIFRRIIPFYSWLRKSTPLLIEGMVMNPGKVVIPSKAMESTQEYATGENVDRIDPFPVDQMFPEWIRSQGVGPLPPEGILGMISNQNPPGDVMVGMGLNPLTQMIGDWDPTGQAGITKPLHSIGSSITPALKIPIELGITGRETFTGEPITGVEARPGATREYIGEQIPIISQFQRMFGVTPFGSETKREERGETGSTEQFVNWLTGLGIKGTGPYQRSAYYEKMAPLWQLAKLNREKFYQGGG